MFWFLGVSGLVLAAPCHPHSQKNACNQPATTALPRAQPHCVTNTACNDSLYYSIHDQTADTCLHLLRQRASADVPVLICDEMCVWGAVSGYAGRVPSLC